MKTFSISTKKRTDLGKKSTKELRAQDMIPCVMYGGEENVEFYAHVNDFRKLIYTPEVFLVDVDVDGKKYKAVMKEIQFHPVTDKVLHIDFIQVFDDKPAVVALPIELTGNSAGILAGGKLRLKKRYLITKGLVKDMPEKLVIDITDLNIGSVIKVSDLSFDNLELLDPAQAMVVGIVTSRLAKTDAEELEEGEEGEEAGEEGSGEESAETTE
ncbi:MAG TPA: 50S ribosomal protein L25 [Bacteroidales bacterium]|jgi:large subunit ribosomal protein L25|nr:50S ribosomal protein L25 [Bacteroidales bacterium]